MYKLNIQQAQSIINVVQTHPYNNVFQLVNAITSCQKDAEGNYLFSVNLVDNLKRYLGEQPFADVFQLLNMINSINPEVSVTPHEADPNFSDENITDAKVATAE